MTIYELMRWIDAGQLSLEKTFSRKKEWTAGLKSKLIESIMIGMPMNGLFVGEYRDGHLQLIDGRQRLYAIRDFVQNKFPLYGTKLEYEGKCFEQLPSLVKRRIEDYQTVVYFVAVENEAVCQAVYRRINISEK